MTEAEELELLELEEAEAQAKAAPARSKPSRGAAALAGVQNLGTFGWGDEIGAGMQDLLMAATTDAEIGDTYHQARDENRAESKAAKDAHPGAYYAAGLPVAVASGLALPAIKAGQGAGLLVRALASGANGAALGGLAGAGDSDAETGWGIAADAGIGALGGAAVGGAIPPLAAGSGYVLRNTLGRINGRGFVSPTPEAKRLGELGVDTSRLSLGQLDPRSSLALMEEAGQANAAVGPVLKKVREGGREAWRDAVMSRATPPNQPLAGGTAAEQLAEANRGFGASYGAIGQNPIATAGPGQQSVADQLRGSFRQAVDDPNTLATDSERATVRRYLENQASAARFQPGKQSTVGDLQGIRSNVRGALHQAMGGVAPDQARGGMLRQAEEALTGQIGQNLPPAEAAALRATDARYSQHKIIEDAVARAKDRPEGLSPSNLSEAVRASSGRGAYARGAGGDLRELASVGREVLDTQTPPTGFRTLVSAAPFQKYWGPPVAAIANTNPTARSFALGETAAQARLRDLLEALRSAQVPAGLSRRIPQLPAELVEDSP